MTAPTQPVLTLAIEIANPTAGGPHGQGGVALGFVVGGDRVGTVLVGSEPMREVDRDRDDLIPAIGRLLAGAGKSLEEVERIAVSVGPGGFTSTRVACATGAMLAEGLSVRGVAVPSALVALIATDTPVDERAIVLMASKGAAAWCAVVETGSPVASWAAQARDGAMKIAQDVLARRPTVALVDSHLPLDIRTALESAGVPIRPLQFTAEACLRASALCVPGDPSTLIPIYPREPEAVTLWRQRHPAPPPH